MCRRTGPCKQHMLRCCTPGRSIHRPTRRPTHCSAQLPLTLPCCGSPAVPSHTALPVARHVFHTAGKQAPSRAEAAAGRLPPPIQRPVGLLILLAPHPACPWQLLLAPLDLICIQPINQSIKSCSPLAAPAPVRPIGPCATAHVPVCGPVWWLNSRRVQRQRGGCPGTRAWDGCRGTQQAPAAAPACQHGGLCASAQGAGSGATRIWRGERKKERHCRAGHTGVGAGGSVPWPGTGTQQHGSSSSRGWGGWGGRGQGAAWTGGGIEAGPTRQNEKNKQEHV